MKYKLKHLESFSKKQVIDKSIICNSLDAFEKVIKKLHSLGYVCNGLPLFNVHKHNYEWDRGMRVINLYNDKEVKFASDHKNLKNVISDTNFLK